MIEDDPVEQVAAEAGAGRGEPRRVLPQVRTAFFAVHALALGVVAVVWALTPQVPHQRSWVVLPALAGLLAVAWRRWVRSPSLALDLACAAALAPVLWAVEAEVSSVLLLTGLTQRSLYGRWPSLLAGLVLQLGVLLAVTAALDGRLTAAQAAGDIPVVLVLVGAFHLLATALHRYEAGSEARFRALVGASSDAILITDPWTQVLYASPALPRVVGPPPGAGSAAGTPLPPGEDLRGRPPLLVDWVVSEDREALSACVSAVLARAGSGVATATCRVRGGDGVLRHVELTVQDELATHGVGGLVVNAHDVTARVQMAERLHRQALHDPLTGLANRVLFAEHLQHAVSVRRGAAAVLMLDLDGFKAVNDTFGHPAGDEMLVRIAERLRSCLRPQDTAARLGGDEFVVLLTGDDVTESLVRQVGERVLTAIAAPMALSDGTVHPGVSIGGALSRRTDTDETDVPRTLETSGQALVHHADLALYRAKAAGGRTLALHRARSGPGTAEEEVPAPGREGPLGTRELHLERQPR